MQFQQYSTSVGTLVRLREDHHEKGPLVLFQLIIGDEVSSKRKRGTVEKREWHEV